MSRIRTLLAVLLALACAKAQAQDDIPSSSGWSGYLLVAPSYFNVKSNVLVTGPPLWGVVGHANIASINDESGTKGSFGLGVVGEINYTFDKSRTQIHFGNRLEDLLRLDVPYGLGVRQELRDSSIIALAVLLTPLELKFWADPYVEGEDRFKTLLTFRGLRLRWGRILRSGLELTATTRWYRHDEEQSGQWLLDQGRLVASDLPLLNRDGVVYRFQALYRIDFGRKHRIEPLIRYIYDDHNGRAMANEGWTTRMIYFYRTPRLIVSVVGGYGLREGRAAHPVYDEILSVDRYGGALSIIMPFKKLENGVLSLTATGEYYVEDFNVDFFDGAINSFIVGVAWRHLKR